MKYQVGYWHVVRNCCISGLCPECRDAEQRPKRIVHTANCSKAYAEHIAGQWAAHNAVAERMPKTPRVLKSSAERRAPPPWRPAHTRDWPTGST